MSVVSVYIHIPFCLRKCNYCDFASRPLAGREQQLAAYPQLLAQELALYSEVDLSGLRTVYLGGGTPSLLEPQAVAELLSLFPPVQEATLEANPETVDAPRLAAFRQAGVTRLSLGVQSFHDELLQAMGRRHSGAQARAAAEAAQAAGFVHVSVDLMFGLPGQTRAQWRSDIAAAVALPVDHISLYGLTLHSGTPWGDAQARGELTPADDDASADLLEDALDLLPAAGFAQYEIANFARPGGESQHNIAYWQRDDYLGLGAAAASCLKARRWSNITEYDGYAAALARGERPVVFDEQLTIEQVLAEAMFLGLRLNAGVDAADFAARYGVNPRRRFRRELARLSQAGLLCEQDGCLRLTRRGLLLGEQVFMEFV